MKGVQDIMMYVCILTLCSLCLFISDKPVQAKSVSEDSIERDSLDIKNLEDIEKPNAGSVDKRKWSDYATWGKRKWDGVAAWGKRWSEGLTSWGKRDQDLAKRQWNQFVTWGKRNAPENKRKDWSSFASWGKRGKWQNFNSWGKRDSNSDAFENEIAERVINRFDFDGDHGLNQYEMLALVNWLQSAGLESQPQQDFSK